jgi:DNA (cytosine-5)-methyltransferase 1
VNVLDLFSGIGGFSLGLERAGMRTVAFCEIDPFCRRVLAKRWPAVPCYDDIRTLTAETLAANAGSGDVQIDVICGGFPCQDISEAGLGAGLDGERSGLWSEFRRLIGEIRPRYAIVENVSALLARGIDRILGDMAELGYDAEWHCIPAAAVGLRHLRARIFVIASPAALVDTDEVSPRHLHAEALGRWQPIFRIRLGEDGSQWTEEPDVGRVAHGIPNGVDRNGSLGNSVVPAIAEALGRAIMMAEAERTA